MNGVSPSREKAPPEAPYFFVTASGAQAIQIFQYSGQDNSLLYKYFLSPLAQYFVDNWTSRTVAPNTITVLGLVLMFLSYAIQYWFAPTMVATPETPSWIHLFHGIAMLIYQTLDNMDGKQARRTSSSSPVGQLVDHGCDSINSMFGSAGWILGMALIPSEDKLVSWMVVFIPLAIFFSTTMEEYFTGSLRLPAFNGPNEGLLGGAVLSFSAWYSGPHIWQQRQAWTAVLFSWYHSEGLRLLELLFLVGAPIFLLEIVRTTVRLAQQYGTQKVLQVFSPFLCLASCTLMIGFIDCDVFLRVPRTLMHLICALFVEMTTHLMFSHMTKQPYDGFRWTLLPLLFLTTAVGTGKMEASTSTDLFLFAYAAAAITWTVTKIAVVLHEFCYILQIWCFDITTPRITSDTKQS
jgi:ethanolaminephosphotransferase